MTFNYDDTYYKAIGSNFGLLHYTIGLNRDTVPFDPSGSCKPGGIYFTDIWNIHQFTGIMRYGVQVAVLRVPRTSQVYRDPSLSCVKWKAPCIEILEIIDIHELNSRILRLETPISSDHVIYKEIERAKENPLNCDVRYKPDYTCDYIINVLSHRVQYQVPGFYIPVKYLKPSVIKKLGPIYLSYVDKYYVTQEICRSAIKTNVRNILDVPYRLMDRYMFQLLIMNFPHRFEHIPNDCKTVALSQLAVQLLSSNVLHVPEKYYHRINWFKEARRNNAHIINMHNNKQLFTEEFYGVLMRSVYFRTYARHNETDQTIGGDFNAELTAYELSGKPVIQQNTR